ncbi:MAG: phenylalanine--tRNA ligase subunit alpha [Chitinophagales bacterium]
MSEGNKDIFATAKDLLAQIEKFTTTDKQELEQFRIAYLGTKGNIKALFAGFKDVPNERKKEFGQVANAVKQAAENKVNLLKTAIEEASTNTIEIPDLTRPITTMPLGSRHPISIVRNQINEIFTRIGFTIAEGPEIEDDWHNFTALNTPEDHPARDMQDTFYIQTNPASVLRSQTSTVQVHVMENQTPPIRIISPGRVYRNETISARAHCQFHQVEGLYIDKDVSFADLKQTLLYFAREMFGKETKIRLRPSFFPFTEPSAEVDIYWGLKDEIDYRITKGTGWLEILGCGMVDPNVLRNCNIDPEVYSGYAWGMGVERIAMLKYRIGDIRLMFQNDVRFLKQFGAAL